MSIRVVCPNGHVLNVKDHLAGKTGLCPTCKARVKVPELPTEELSEDSIMSILGPHVPDTASVASVEEPAEVVEVPMEAPAGGSRPPKKSCHKCNRQISAELHICPFCHTYIAKLSDF